jgi:hypothetical protein
MANLSTFERAGFTATQRDKERSSEDPNHPGNDVGSFTANPNFLAIELDLDPRSGFRLA